MKQCLTCKNIKSLVNFHRYKNDYKSSCKECRNAAKRLYRKLNQQKCNTYNKNWQKQNPMRANKATAKWKKNNIAKINALNSKRYAAKLQRTPKWLTETHYQQIEIFYDAASQLTQEFGIKMEVDHIVPLQGKNVSGLHVPWNLQILSKKLNSGKRNTF